MALRSEPITRLPLAPAGVRCSKAQIQEIEAELLRNLLVDVPILDHLRASELGLDYEVIDKSLWLLVVLQEVQQKPFPFAGKGAGSKVAVTDPYMDDLNDVCNQLSKVEGRILIAVSGVASPLDGTVDAPAAPSTTTIRRRVKRGLSDGSILIAGMPFPTKLFIEDLPSILPQGPRVVISALVKGVEIEFAFLTQVKLESSEAPGVSFKFWPSLVLPMARIGHFQQVEHGIRLVVAMHARKRLRLEVVAALSWDKGEVVAFELKQILED